MSLALTLNGRDHRGPDHLRRMDRYGEGVNIANPARTTRNQRYLQLRPWRDLHPTAPISRTVGTHERSS
jgi:hypothetical protein